MNTAPAQQVPLPSEDIVARLEAELAEARKERSHQHGRADRNAKEHAAWKARADTLAAENERLREALADHKRELKGADENAAEASAALAKVLDESYRRGTAIDRLGPWLSAALDDSATCAEMKADIEAWFEALSPEGR